MNYNDLEFLCGYTICISIFLLEVLDITSREKRNLVNEEIRYQQVLVIGPKGEQLGVKPIKDALVLSNYSGFDLVLINDSTNPPVCKLMDYNKFKYEKKKKIKENLKKQRETSFELKEIRLSVTIQENDFNTKVKNARKLLEKSNKIKVSLRFKGRQLAHKELGEDVLKKFAEKLVDICEIEQQPKFEFKGIYMILMPNKK